MYPKGYPNLSVDLTHRCNLNCSFCWKFVRQRKFDYMTEEQLDDFCKYFRDVPFSRLRVVGGEPLLHPHFFDVMFEFLDVFKKPINVITNGILLTDTLLDIPNVVYTITPYPQNAEIIKKYNHHPNFAVLDRTGGYFDRDHDPNFSDKDAKIAHETCGYHQIRVIGDNVYDCCHAETMERLRGCPNVHVKMSEGCLQELAEKDNLFEECRHCFIGDKGRIIG